MTNKIIVYTSDNCSFCTQAKKLLQSKGLNFDEFNIQRDENSRSEMLEKSNGMRTVPQIFINDTHVGGYSELSAIVTSGDLNNLLIDEHKE
jgi:glutaredoxin 3|tara:strand:- start:2884 stop:3156 length:273 start_codon:yes stop_codon:yes gene_type:complete